MPSPSPQYTLQLSTNRADTDFKVKMSVNLQVDQTLLSELSTVRATFLPKKENKKRPASLQVFA
jgi:hypothetical protein